MPPINEPGSDRIGGDIGTHKYSGDAKWGCHHDHDSRKVPCSGIIHLLLLVALLTPRFVLSSLFGGAVGCKKGVAVMIYSRLGAG
jgi:hypothetical protein